MSSQVITIKVDPTTKKQAQLTAKQLGLSLSAVIKDLLKHFIKTKSVTFNELEEIPNARTIKILKQAEENLKKGNHSPVFGTGEEAVAWLKKQGI